MFCCRSVWGHLHCGSVFAALPNSAILWEDTSWLPDADCAVLRVLDNELWVEVTYTPLWSRYLICHFPFPVPWDLRGWDGAGPFTLVLKCKGIRQRVKINLGRSPM